MLARRPALRLEPLEAREVPAVFTSLRVVDYNIAGDVRTGFSTILQEIGTQTVAGLARPVDILLLQESDSQATDTQAAVNALNTLYGTGTYARGSLDGSSTGAGRPGIVYHVSSVDLIAEVAITGGTGPRQPIRYQLRPDGLDSSYDFYIFNSHYDSSDPPDRLTEAQAIRTSADALGAGSEILYAGDFNIDSSSEGMYTHLLSSGNGQAFDPINMPGTWTNNNAFRSIHTQAPSTVANFPGQITAGMDDRFDIVLHTQEVGASGVASDGLGLEYRAGSYRAFGNNGTHTLDQRIGTGTGASPAALAALENTSDHIPVVVDYDIVTPGGDTTPPTVVSIDDGDPDDVVAAGTAMTYTVTFSEDILNGSFTAADLNNAGTAPVAIGTITETSPGVFSVGVTPTAGGTLVLRIPTGAVVEDVAGNDLVVPVQDNTTVTVTQAPVVTLHPASQTKTIGEGPVFFTAAATGSPAPTVRWQICPEGVGGVFFNLNNNAVYSGVTTDTLTFLGTVTLSNSGAAYRAVYTNASGTATTNPAVLTVVPGTTTSTTTVAVSPNPLAAGQTYTVTATVTGGSGVPTGVVYFNGGTTPYGLNASGVASFTATAGAAGSFPFTANYVGDATYAASTSNTVTLVVNPAATTTSVVSSLNPSVVGQAVTFTATVSPNPNGGTVTFYDNGTAIGTAPVDEPGTATLTTSALAAGTHPITAVFNGNASYLTSTSPALSQVVTGSATFGVASTALLPGGVGFLVTFNAAYDIAALNLYAGDAGGTLDARDVQVTGPGGIDFGVGADELRFTAVPVSATALALVLSGPSRVAAAGLLPAGGYAVTLQGGTGSAAFKRLADGAFLDGNGNGTVAADDDYAAPAVTAAAVAADVAVFSAADVVAGPGQTVGVPLVVSNDTNDVRGVALTVATNPLFGEVIGFTANPAIAGVSAAFTPATGALTVSAPAAFAATDAPFLVGTFQVRVPGLGNPGTAPALGNKGLLDLTVTGATTAAGAAKPALADDGVHVVAYPGDVRPLTGAYSGADVSAIQSLVVGFTSALALYPNADPRLLADVNRDGSLSGADVSTVQGWIIGGSPLPPGAGGVAAGGSDPRLYLVGGAARPGEALTVQLRMEVTEPAGVTVSSGDYALRFDPTRVRVTGVRTGSMLAGFALLTHVDHAAGIIRATQFAAADRAFGFGADGDVLLIDLLVLPGARPGPTPLNLMQKVTSNGSTTWTGLGNAAGQLTLVPAPTDAATDPGDAVLLVRGRETRFDTPRRAAFAAPDADDLLVRPGRRRI